MRRVRRSAAIGEAVASGRRARQAYRAKRMIIRDSAGFRERCIAAANYLLRMSNAFVLVLAGCATGDVGQVKEVGPGTYKIGTGAAGNSVLIGGNDANNAAVEQAGEYCHAKGQKLVIVPSQGKDVTFRCGDTTKTDE